MPSTSITTRDLVGMGFASTLGTYNYNIPKQPLGHQGLSINLGYPATLQGYLGYLGYPATLQGYLGYLGNLGYPATSQILKALISNDNTIHSVPQ